jgi:hypothetical protein
MTKADFLNSMREYAGTLIGSDLDDEELASWIRKEADEKDEELTDTQIDWIVEMVREIEMEET